MNQRNKGMFQRILERNKKKSIDKGIYIYGSVGSGKTMIMDLFYESVVGTSKQRFHFHQFMIETHKRLHAIKLERSARSPKKKAQFFDPIPIVADQMCRDCRLLCFDEFQVTDIADAMILRRLFENILQTGIVIVATSNRHPDDLYKRGLQRANFLPFIDFLKEHSEILCLDSEIDYRKLILSLSTTENLYLTNNNCTNPSEKLQSIFEETTNGLTPKETVLTVFGRKVSFKKTIGPVLYATFSELCQQPLSAADYLEISKSFHTVFCEGIPLLKISQRNRLRRFITMIDAFYDSKIRFICSASEEPEKLFISSENGNDEHLHSTRVLMDDLGLKEADANHRQSTIFTDEEEIFAHHRTISRLVEMRSRHYWDCSNHPLLLTEKI